MAIANYSDLQGQITDFLARSDLSGSATDFITLGEARINRLIEDLEQDVTLNAVADSNSIDISILDIIEPVALWRNDGVSETPIELKALGTFPLGTVAGDPYAAAIDGDTLEFDKPLQSGMTFRFVYRGRVQLSDSNTTNDILTNHPDVYLAASLFWGGLRTRNSDLAAAYKGLWDQFSKETRHTIAQQKRSTLTPLRGIVRGRGKYRTYDGT